MNSCEACQGLHLPPVVLDDEITGRLEKKNTIPSLSNESFNWWVMNKNRVIV